MTGILFRSLIILWFLKITKTVRKSPIIPTDASPRLLIAAISAIPKIVCETIHALELHDETPSWKIMDNKGRVTVVLHWDQRSSTSQAQQQQKGQDVQTSKYSPTKKTDLSQRPPLVIQTSLDKLNYGGKLGHLAAEVGPSRYSSPHITVINHDDMQQQQQQPQLQPQPHGIPGRLVKQGTNSFDSTTIHIHTPECSNHIHQPVVRNGSPVNGADGGASGDKGHVRFCDTADEESSSRLAGNSAAGFHLHHHHNHHQEHDSSESETENTIMEDEIVTSEKFLLLIDQLTVDQKHLSIKDIGIILERLSSKILDVERLDRESESEECYNWTIKAIIRGDVLRELGVIYNGNYYAISEHPGYKEESEENNEDNEEEEEDRL
ncbi:hypothetical protein E2986_11293 [Frieseomelitta varia]|uniref:Uncharacterized protein n=1 Tax=Frieseomelitta varia TaxID=561572 RepID=A0A833SCK6_9HYME|nr:hypothetical protein E2986_11293 [Frieseomelitta varia]